MNRKLLITAPMHYSQRLLKAFERYKDRVDVLHIPMVESTFDNTSEQMRELCDNLDKYDFVILTLCIFYRTRIPYFRPIAHAAVNTRAKIRKCQVISIIPKRTSLR